MKFMTKPTRWGRMSIATIVSAISFLQPLSAQEKLNNIEPALLKQDFTVFRDVLRQEHAGLYRYKSKTVLDKLFDSCSSTLNHPMTQLEFAKSVMFIISAIKDGHTGTNIPRLLMNYYSGNEKMFPAHVFYIDKKAYVLCSVKEFAAGTEILSIDNNPVSGIRERLFQYLPSDGRIETKKQQTLNNGAFPFIYNWIFGNKESFVVKYRTKEGEAKTVTIRAEFVKDVVCDYENRANKTSDLKLDILQGNTALLTIKTFDDNRLSGKQDFREFLSTSFKEIDSSGKVNRLIIDLRGNAGGADAYGALLYSYLTREPFKYFASIESTTSKISAKENSLLGIQQPQKHSFNGEVFFLVNGLSFSTTADFCSVAKSNNRGKFIGEETGGGYYGNTSGETSRIELPNSKINIIVPKLKYLNDVKKTKYKDRGVIPDYVIIPTIDDVISQRDVQLNFALGLPIIP